MNNERCSGSTGKNRSSFRFFIDFLTRVTVIVTSTERTSLCRFLVVRCEAPARNMFHAAFEANAFQKRNSQQTNRCRPIQRDCIFPLRSAWAAGKYRCRAARHRRSSKVKNWLECSRFLFRPAIEREAHARCTLSAGRRPNDGSIRLQLNGIWVKRTWPRCRDDGDASEFIGSVGAVALAVATLRHRNAAGNVAAEFARAALCNWLFSRFSGPFSFYFVHHSGK